MKVTPNPGYVLGQLEKALITASEHRDAATRERAVEKIERFRRVLDGMQGGSLAIGSRTPVAGVPAWATLEVAHGGFATGNLLAGGPLQPHEIEMCKEVPVQPGAERAALNLRFLSDEGRAELLARLSSGRYRIHVPEEGALLVVAWLLEHGQSDLAATVLEAILGFIDRLRFYPVPDPEPLLPSAVVKLLPASAVAASLRATPANARILRMNEALRVWTPVYDRAVALFLETVEGETPHLRTGDKGDLARRPDGQPIVEGGWPCKRYPAGWHDRAAALLAEYESLRSKHRLCGKPEDPKQNFAILRRALARLVEAPAALTGIDVGSIRRVLAGFVTKHGAPGSDKHARLRAEQATIAARPTNQEVARVVATRLATCSGDAGLPALEPVTVPITEPEATEIGIPPGAAIPASVVHKLERCLEAPLEDLIHRSVIPSSEVLAIVLPQITSQVGAAGLSDPALARLYSALYAAFRRRRSLLLVNLESQVRLDDLPWVAAIRAQRTDKLEGSARARQTLAQISSLAIASFPETILPNKLLQEMRALASSAGLRLPLVDELAADIFMGEFSGKFVEAAKIAARLLAGSLYARYYDLPIDTILRIEDVKKQRDEYGVPSSAEFAALCADRATLDEGSSVSSWVARNGKIIEQEQILTTHNLATLFETLALLDSLAPRLPALAQACFRFICAKEQQNVDKWHARLVRTKNSAYAWRQMVFYLSFLPPAEVETFLGWAEDHLRDQDSTFRNRFTPALRGLVIAALGGDLAAAQRTGTARRFLGWSTGRHWLLAGD